MSMTHTCSTVRSVSQAPPTELWSSAWLEQQVRLLHRSMLQRQANVQELASVAAITQLGMQPDVLAALRERRSPQPAVQDLATRYAFAQLMVEGKAIYELDAFLATLVQQTLDTIHQRAASLSKERGIDPLEADDRLLLAICKQLSRYNPRRPMHSHIQWKLKHYESVISRAMRQIKHLLTLPEVTDCFITFLMHIDVPQQLKDDLSQIAQSGSLKGVNYEAVIRFFARNDVVAFVKDFACKLQTARTLYTEEEYAGIIWSGKRRLPHQRRQGYLDAALAEYERWQDASLDAAAPQSPSDCDVAWHEALHLKDDHELEHEDRLHCESFAAWVTRYALAAHPDAARWRVAALLFIENRVPEELVATGVTDAETVAGLRMQIDDLRADPDIWHAWMASCIGKGDCADR